MSAVKRSEKEKPKDDARSGQGSCGDENNSVECHGVEENETAEERESKDLELKTASCEDVFVPERSWGFVYRWPAWKLTAVVLLALAVLYLPMAGSYGLWDPWETHYGEVSRSMLQRNDPVSMFWQDGWFWSKPVLTFWLQAFGMRVLGVNSLDSPASEMALSSRPEWGMRLPVILLSILSLWVLFHVLRRLLGRRTAVLSVIICATSPLYAFTTRQSITDIPFVGPMTAALALIMLAFFTDRDKPAPRLDWAKPWMLIPCTAFFMLLLAPGQDAMSRFYVDPGMLVLHLLVCAVAVVLNLKWKESSSVAGKAAGGSKGGKSTKRRMISGEGAADWKRYLIPLAGELIITAVGLFVWGTHVLNWSIPIFIALAFGNAEPALGRRVPVTLWHLFGLALGVISCLQFVFFSAFIGDGFNQVLVPAEGVAINFYGFLYMLPWIALWVFYIVSTVSTKVVEARYVYIHTAWLLAGIAVLAKGLGGVAIPVAVVGLYIFLSRRWRLIMDLDLPRGLAVWFAVAAPWHHAMWVRHGKGFWNEYFGHHHFKRAQSGVHGERGAMDYFTAQLGFGMFPWSALIPAAVLRWASKPTERDEKGQVRIFLAIWAGLCFALFSIMETKFHHYVLPAVPPMAVLIAMWMDDVIERRDKGVLITVVASLGLLVLLARDLIRDPQHLVRLFIYKYDRLFPYELGFETALVLLTILMGIPLALLIFRKLRPYAVWGMTAAGFLFGLWLLGSYMYRVSPHWGQKELHATYYRSRKGPEERLIAWELNWRGENFYTKNRVVVHMQPKDVEKFKAYLRRYTGETFYIILEAGRYQKLKRTLPTERAKQTLEIVGPDGKPWPDKWVPHFRDKRFQVLQKPYMSNKFLLVRTTI